MRVERVFLGLLLVLCLFPLVFSSNFTSNPQIIIPPGINITTVDNLTCSFIATGTGTLYANITWYVNDINWNYNDLNNILLNSSEEFNTSISSDNTSRGQKWNCQVTITDNTNTTIKNSSQITIQNSKPVVIDFIRSLTINEDTTYLLNLSAIDYDGDNIRWGIINTELDENPVFLYENPTNSNTLAITPRHEDLTSAWLETQRETGFYIRDTEGGPLEFLNITIKPVNDGPQFNNLPTNLTCYESSECYFEISAVDEESDPIIFSTNSTLFNITNLTSTSVYFNFTPNNQQSNQTFNISFSVKDSPPPSYSSITKTSYLVLKIIDVDIAPRFINWSNTKAFQNQTDFFIFNITAYDEDEDIMEIIVENNCPLPPTMWNLTTLTNGSLGTNATSQIKVNFSNTTGYKSNDFVICRDVTFKVNAENKTDTIDITLNITNTNDAPYISDTSFFNQTIDPSNKLNITNLSAAIGTKLYYKVNATDPDELTYEDEILTYEVLNYTNLFFINNETGILTTNIINNITYNQTSYNITIKVTDDGDTLTKNNTLSYEKIATIFIVNNTVPFIHPINDSNCEEGSQCLKYLLADDPDAGENLTSPILSCLYTNPLNVNNTECGLLPVFVSDNETTTVWKLDFLPTNKQVGEYKINVSFTDSRGASVTEYFQFNITNFNTPPYLSDNEDPEIIENITFGIIVVNRSYTKQFYAHDDDLYYELDNLTFHPVEIISGNFSGTISLEKISENSGQIILFTPYESDIGNHTINISVTDIGNETTYQEVTFEVFPRSPPPIFAKIKPHNVEEGLNINYKNINSTQKNETIYFNENTNITFGVELVEYPHNHTFYWYLDGEYLSNSSSNEKSFNFDYWTSGNHNFTVEAEDKYYSKSNFTWILNINDLNQNVVFVNDLENLTAVLNREILGETLWTDFFVLHDVTKMVFYDPDDDLDKSGVVESYEPSNLEFSIYEEENFCDGAAEFVFNGKDLTITPLVEGKCLTKFIARDSHNSTAISNQIEIDLFDPKKEAQTTRVIVQTEVQLTQIEVEVPEPEEFKIIEIGVSAVYDNGTVIVPITLHNSWENIISDIYMSANGSEENLKFTFSNDYISSMYSDERRNISLIVENYRLEAPLQINVTADVKSLDYQDSSVIYINALESSGVTSNQAIQTRISFARDLLSDNPECMELIDVLNRAEKEVGDDNFKALETVNSAIAGCKYMINKDLQTQSTMPTSVLGRTVDYVSDYVDVQLFGIIFFVITAIAILIGIISHFTLKKI